MLDDDMPTTGDAAPEAGPRGRFLRGQAHEAGCREEDRQTAAKKAVKKAPAKKAAAKKTSAKKAAAEPPPADQPRPTGPPRRPPTRRPRSRSGRARRPPRPPSRPRRHRHPRPTPAPSRSSRCPRPSRPGARARRPPRHPRRLTRPTRPTQTSLRRRATRRATRRRRASDSDGEDSTSARRRRRRGGRRRRKSGDSAEGGADTTDETEDADSADDSSDDQAGEGTSRRRRRRRRSGDDGGDSNDDPQNTVTRVRRGRSAEDEITAVAGSTRLEAKKQRRREGREAGRRRAPIVSEAEFLARRESVERVMVIRQRDELTQIGVLEDKVLVEHYVARESQTSLIGNVYLGRVQNVLPSMEAAFVDIGKGRNAVLYAGEVNWSALGHPDGQPRKIESVLSSGQQILVQVTKDPIGHKGARLTSQVSLAGRFLVYVPDGTTSGISRKLPDTERNRLKTLLKDIVPDTAGVIVRTAAEGASEEELTRDVERLRARWEDIEKKAKGSAPQLLYGEPDLTLKVVRDLFTEDFVKMVIEGDDAWETVQDYVAHVAPDLGERLERYRPEEHDGRDVFAAYRLDEQIHKGLDRKVWLPSGGSLIIDRTEAMTVVDVNTGKFTGSGGNLEETVTKNNLEAAEEMVRQLRLRDIGGIIVVDFIDMVLESNRDLVLRRLVECLGRDRTRHQVAEVTSLGLVQMTRKRIGTGLLESFSHECEHCHGRGLVIEDAPVEPRRTEDDGGRRTGRRGRGRGEQQPAARSSAPSPKDVAAMAKQHEHEHDQAEDEAEDEVVETTEVEAVAAEAPEVETPEPAEAEAEIEPEDEDEAPEEPPAPPVAPEPPKVVTRTRRRAASRPAGPPAAAPEPEAGAVLVADRPTRSSEQPRPRRARRARAARADQEEGLAQALTCGLTVLHVVHAGPYYEPSVR